MPRPRPANPGGRTAAALTLSAVPARAAPRAGGNCGAYGMEGDGWY